MDINKDIDINSFIDIICNTKIFKHLESAELSSLFDYINYRLVLVDENTLIHTRDEICDNIFIVLEGTLSLNQCNYDNKPFNIHTFIAGDIVGANSIFAQNSKYKVDIYTKTPSVLIYIPRFEILNLCINDKIFLQSYLMHMSDKSQKLLNKIRLLSNKNIRLSIKQFLSEEYNKQKSLTIKLDISKKELAEILCIERTSLSRELKAMKLDGIIDYDKHSITISSLDSILNSNKNPLF